MSGKATATLTFHTQTADQNGVADGRIALVALRKSGGTASLGARTGRVVFPIKGTLSERVKTKRRNSPTSPYEEQTCANTRKLSSRGGVTLRRVGSNVEVRWAFPQANPSFCQGPRAVTTKMRRLVPATRFAASRLTLVLAGSTKAAAAGKSVTYRWRATIKLVGA